MPRRVGVGGELSLLVRLGRGDDLLDGEGRRRRRGEERRVVPVDALLEQRRRGPLTRRPARARARDGRADDAQVVARRAVVGERRVKGGPLFERVGLLSELLRLLALEGGAGIRASFSHDTLRQIPRSSAIGAPGSARRSAPHLLRPRACVMTDSLKRRERLVDVFGGSGGAGLGRGGAGDAVQPIRLPLSESLADVMWAVGAGGPRATRQLARPPSDQAIRDGNMSLDLGKRVS